MRILQKTSQIIEFGPFKDYFINTITNMLDLQKISFKSVI